MLDIVGTEPFRPEQRLASCWQSRIVFETAHQRRAQGSASADRGFRIGFVSGGLEDHQYLPLHSAGQAVAVDLGHLVGHQLARTQGSGLAGWGGLEQVADRGRPQSRSSPARAARGLPASAPWPACRGRPPAPASAGRSAGAVCRLGWPACVGRRCCRRTPRRKPAGSEPSCRVCRLGGGSTAAATATRNHLIPPLPLVACARADFTALPTTNYHSQVRRRAPVVREPVRIHATTPRASPPYHGPRSERTIS